MDFYKFLAIVSPFVSATLSGFLTYFYTLRTKKIEILYQNNIPAFREITQKLIELKRFCNGRIAFFQANEFSPDYEENIGTLAHRTEISNASNLNSVFLSSKSKDCIDKLLNELSGLCNAEISIIQGNEMLGIENEYLRVLNLTDNCINTLFKELKLKN